MIGWRILVFLLFVLPLVSCGSAGIDTEVSYDRRTDFNTNRTYQWVQQETQEYAPKDVWINESFLTTVKLHITGRLAAKGFKKAQTPQFLVNYAIGPSQNVRLRQGGIGVSGTKYSPFLVTTELQTVLVIDVSDAVSGRSLWRGWAPLNKETGQDQLDAAKATADAVLGRFPP